MTATPAPRQPLLAELESRLRLVAERARLATDGADAATRSLAPPGGGWSMDQVLEHVMKLDEDYLRAIDAALSAANPSASPPAWKPSLPGRLLVWAMREQNRMKAPTAAAYDGLAPRADTPRAFQRHLEDMTAAIRRADGFDLRALRVRSPLAAALVLNAGDALRVLVTHAERHMGQLERTRTAVAG